MKEDLGEDDDDEDELTDEELEAILEALDSYDEVQESEVELDVWQNSVDENCGQKDLHEEIAMHES